MATDTEIKASKEPARNNYGQNGNPLASSLLPGESKSPIADVAPPQGSFPSLSHDDQLSHRVKMDGDKPAAYPAHDAMKNRSTAIESIPSATNYRAK